MGCRHRMKLNQVAALSAAVLMLLLAPALSAAADPFLFDAARLFPAGQSPRSKVLEDLDGDGRQDLAVVSYAGGAVEILLGSGDGVFTSAASYPTTSSPSGLGSGDLDNDGDIDLVVSHQFNRKCVSGCSCPVKVQDIHNVLYANNFVGEKTGEGDSFSVGGRCPASMKAGKPISTPQEWKRSLESRGPSPLSREQYHEY